MEVFFVANVSPLVGKFVWLSDIHVRIDTGEYIYEEGELQAIFDFVDTQEPMFVIASGDVADDALEAQFTEYNALCASLATATTYTIPGNHDTDNLAKDATNYLAAGLTEHFAFTSGDLKIIGLRVDLNSDVNWNGVISESELAYCESEMQSAAGKKIIVVSHFPLTGARAIVDPGGAALLALLQTYNAKAYLSGHVHEDCLSSVVGGVTHVSGGSTAYTYGTIDGGLMICTVYGNRIEIDYRRARTPFGSFGSGTTPSYTPITIWLT